ncbi:MAG TPA: cytochrome c peroxidase [Steroidobacteraceae bacterium]|nr:cytochrome c peroxidase [Steroidobacteraceae bacterium]
MLVIAACVLASCAAPRLHETHLRQAPVDFDWRLPPGFPAPDVPADNRMSAAKVELGRELFYEQRLSFNGAVSCASCHVQRLGFADGHRHAIGATGEAHPRSSMPLANVAYNSAFTWSDRKPHSLEEQMIQPLFNEHPVEMGLATHESLVVGRIAGDESYRRQFASVFAGDPQPVTLANIVRAIASFERTLVSGRSSFDRFLFDDDAAAMTPAARRGMTLFFGPRAGCGACHSGLMVGGAEAHYANTGVEQGSRVEFRVPSLRNVEVTAPYMHDGSLPTLESVLDHYTAGGRHRGPGTDARIHPFELSADERLDLIEFMRALTDREFLADSRFAQP